MGKWILLFVLVMALGVQVAEAKPKGKKPKAKSVPTATVRIKLWTKDPELRGLPGVFVTLRKGKGKTEEMISAKTDSRGLAIFKSVPHGTWSISLIDSSQIGRRHEGSILVPLERKVKVTGKSVTKRVLVAIAYT